MTPHWAEGGKDRANKPHLTAQLGARRAQHAQEPPTQRHTGHKTSGNSKADKPYLNAQLGASGATQA